MDTKKEKDKENLHVGHRKRMRYTLRATGGKEMFDHQILEILLMFIINRRDTNELAHKLIKKFSSLYGVLSAPKEELISIKGIGEKSADFLCQLNKFLEFIDQPEICLSRHFIDFESYKATVASMLSDGTENEIILLLFNNNMVLLNTFIYDTSKPIDEIKNDLLTKMLNMSFANCIACYKTDIFSDESILLINQMSMMLRALRLDDILRVNEFIIQSKNSFYNLVQKSDLFLEENTILSLIYCNKVFTEADFLKCRTYYLCSQLENPEFDISKPENNIDYRKVLADITLKNSNKQSRS